jgi:hypothetical protein
VKKPALWTCPLCGQRFVTKNMSHSCGAFTIDSHFQDKDPIVRELFEALVAAARRFGDVHVYAQKTRIVFQTRGRFVSLTPRKSSMAGHLWLKKKRSHPTIHRIESLADRDFVHNFRLERLDQIDRAFRELMKEAYAVGSQDFRSG